MSFNFSSPSNSSLDSDVFQCTKSAARMFIVTAFTAIKAVLLLPLSVFILYLGHQQWRQQRSFTATSHSDIFTYHVAVMCLIWGLGIVFICCVAFTDFPEMILVWYCLSAISNYGENFFHVLTCAERYLAVVHPITYLGLRNARGVRIRNVSTGCVWLLSFAWMVVMTLCPPTLLIIPLFFPLTFSLVVVSFCSLSVLCVLIRPGLGDKGQDKKPVDQSKQKAFITITAIMVVLLWFGGVLVSFALGVSNVGCVMRTSSFWFSLPSSLVLPLLYLHRAGKLPCCCSNSE